MPAVLRSQSSVMHSTATEGRVLRPTHQGGSKRVKDVAYCASPVGKGVAHKKFRVEPQWRSKGVTAIALHPGGVRLT